AVERDSRGAGAGRACAVPGSGGPGPAPFRPGGIDQLQLAGHRAGGFDADRARLAGAPGNQQLLFRVTEAQQDDVLRRAVGRAEERVVLDDRADRLQHPVCRLEGIVLSEQAEVVLALAFVRAVVAKVVPPVAPYVEYRSDQEEAARQIGGLKAFVDAAAAWVGRPAHFREVRRHRLAGDAGQFEVDLGPPLDPGLRRVLTTTAAVNVRMQRETVDRLHDAGLEQALGETGFDSLGGYRTGEHRCVRIVLADDARRIGDQPDVVLGEPWIVWVLDIPLVPDLVMRDATPELLRDECDVTVERGANRLATRLLP